MAVGNTIFLTAFGISVLSHGALPKWIGWIAVVLAVIGLTPLGLVSFIASGFLIAIIGVVLALRGRAGPSAPGAGPPAGTGLPPGAAPGV